MKMTVSCLQITSGDDISANIAMIERMLKEAVAAGSQFIALPENAFYMRREAHHKDDAASYATPRYYMEDHPGVLAVKTWAKQYRVWILVGSVSVYASEAEALPHNRSLLINPEGQLVAVYDKIHLFDVELDGGETYMESARIKPGNSMVIAPTPWGGLGMSVCYDLRFPYLYRDLATHGAKIISIPAAFAVATGKVHWHVLNRARAIENGAFVISAAQCGEHPGGRKTFGHSLIINPWGEVLADGGDQMGVVSATIDMEEVERIRKKLPSLKCGREYRKIN